MRKSVFYKKLKIKNALHVSVRALVPAYLYTLYQLFYRFPDVERPFFHKKNALFGPSY
jgi:hypothetical protein